MLALILLALTAAPPLQALAPPTPTPPAAVPAAPAPEPQLDTAEQTALSAMSEEMQNTLNHLKEVQARIDKIRAEFAEHHPGWFLDPRDFHVVKSPERVEPKKKP